MSDSRDRRSLLRFVLKQQRGACGRSNVQYEEVAAFSGGTTDVSAVVVRWRRGGFAQPREQRVKLVALVGAQRCEEGVFGVAEG